MSSECKFIFQKGCETFFYGDNFEGTINLTTVKGKTIKGVYIFLTGQRKIKWPDPRFSVGVDSSVDVERNIFWSYEKIIEVCTKVRGSGVLPTGTHSYFFSFQPELDWPTSIEGKYGFVRYELYLLVERRYNHDNIFKKPITILRHFDLNVNPSYKEPAVSEVHIPICCSLVTKCKLYCSLRTTYGAYAPGQIVRFHLEIHNSTGKTIDGVFIRFIRRMTFVARRPALAEQIVETDLISRYTAVEPVSDYILEDDFAIPATPPTSLARHMIYVEYLLRVQAKLSVRLSSSLQTEVKLVIGTVPLKDSLEQCQLEEPSQPEASSPQEAIAQLTTASITPYSRRGIKPPSYAMDIVCDTPFIDTDVEEYNRVVGYRPQYPVYRLPAA